MNIDTSLKMAWLAGGALVAGACTTDDTTEVRNPVAMIAVTDVEHADSLRGLRVDRATYDTLVVELGAEPRGVAILADAPDGTIEMLLAPTSPIVSAYLDDPASVPPLSIAFDDGSSEPVALLLPAVQKLREAAMHGQTPAQPAGTMTITLDGQAGIGLLLPAVQKVREAANRAHDDRAASINVLGTHVPGISPAQRAQLGLAFAHATEIDHARFAGTDSGLAVGALQLPSNLGSAWSAAGTPMNLVVDIRMDGPVLRRVRVPRALPGSPTTAPAATPVPLQGLAMLTRNGDSERTMFDAGAASFSSDAIDKIKRMLLDYAGNTSMSLAIAQWSSGRTAALADIIVGTGPGGAPGYEAMSCVAALPTAVAVASALVLDQPERASAAATVEEAASATSPMLGLVVGGTLAMQAYGAPTPAGDAELACAAVRQLAALPDTAASPEGQSLRMLALDLDAFDARRLEIELANWIAAMDKIVANPDETAWAAARGKADILIESLTDAATHTEARWQIAGTMLGR